MGRYVYIIICTSVFVFLMIAVSPGGGSGKYSKHIALVGSLLLAVVIASPLKDILMDINFDFNNSSADSISENREAKGEYYASSAVSVLKQAYGAELGDANASVAFFEDGEIKTLVLYLEGDASFNEKEAAGILTDIYGFEVEIKEGTSGEKAKG